VVLTEADDLLHEPDERKKFRESYYFNWVDIESRVSGFTTIGILPNEKKREFVFVLFVDDDMAAVHYKEPVMETRISEMDSLLTDGTLAYRMVKPLEKWEITLETENISFKVDFKTRFKTHEFGMDSSASWHGHFEASGRVTGTVRIKNSNERNIQGYGQRDKSWGYRDWHQFSKWYAGHVQFENYAIGFRKDYQGEKADLSGFVSTESGNFPLEELEIETINEEDENSTPFTSSYQLKAGGKIYMIKTERLGKKTGFRFARDFNGGYTELFEQMVVMEDEETGVKGTGMAEYLRRILK